ncbi:unnamed protein product [Rodentolepis nana]|uniref:Cell cycle regulator Mat89Bb n=1 Tax=Rodentolepis nana TaxID=102285 RepID=A0A158QGT2_RODNA|nr:unnamed protein product [Rodentolepis nana]
MAFVGSQLNSSYFRLMLPDRMHCDVPFTEALIYPLYKNTERYEQCLNAAFLTASISEDRFCFMLEPGEDARTLELVVPVLPSSLVGFNSPRTNRLLLFAALRAYLKNKYTYANKSYLKEIKLMRNFMAANETSKALNFESQRQVDTILASNISVTQFLKSLIAEPEIRCLWAFVKGKSGDVYRLRICDTELALFKETGYDPAIKVWPWQEIGVPKSTKKEIRMPWLITDDRPQLSDLLLDVLNSKRPENLNDAKRRRLSRADSIPTSIVFEAKYHYTITVFAEDSNSANKLVYQILSVRAMALASENHPAPNAEKIKVPPQGDTSAELTAVPAAQMLANGITKEKKKTTTTKKKGFSLCGLNCMGGKKKGVDVGIDDSLQPNYRPVDLAQPPPQATQSQTELIPTSSPAIEPSSQKTVKAKVESTTVLVDRHSSSGSNNEGNAVVVEKAPHVSSSTYSETLSQNCGTVEPVKTSVGTFTLSASPPNFSNHVNSTHDPKRLTNGGNAEVVDGTVEVSTQEQYLTSNSSGGKVTMTPRSSIPLPRNPAKAMMGTFHSPSSSPSEENLESRVLTVTPVTPVRSPEKQSKPESETDPSQLFAKFGASRNRNNSCAKDGYLSYYNICAVEPPESERSKKSTDATSAIVHSSLGAPTTPNANQNGFSVLSSSGSITASSPPTPTPSTQTRRTSGLVGPRVVVNKPGIKMYKGGNASSLTSSQSSLGKSSQNEREAQNNGNDVSMTSTPLIIQNSAVSSPSTPLRTVAPVLPTPTASSPAAVSPKPTSNIRPPSVIVEGLPSPRTRLSRSSIPTSNSRHDSANSSSTNLVSTPRSIPTPTTGIRMPSRLPRQTAAKVI